MIGKKNLSDNVRVTAIIQARMQSKRLPGKSILPLSGKPIIAHVIERTLLMEGVQCVVVATCPGNDDLVSCAKECGAQTFVGSEPDVLERYTLAAREFGGDYIVRVTGDNPFTDVKFGSIAIAHAVETESDLSSVSGLPIGAGIEMIKRTALETAYSESSTSYQREHVSPFIKEHPERFSIQRLSVQVDNPFPELRLTVDTPEDYQMAQKVYDRLYKGVPFSIEETILFVREHPEIADINKEIKQRPMTHSENQTK